MKTLKVLFKLMFVLLIVFLFIGIAFSTAIKFLSQKEPFINPLMRSEEDFRMTTALIGELASDIELMGVTVIPHVKSGVIANEPWDDNGRKDDIGALLNIYIRNNSTETITPHLTFNGKTANDHILEKNHSVSWANTPCTRQNRLFDKEREGNEFDNFIPLSTELESGAIDAYSINVTDGNLLYEGLELIIEANGKTASATLFADHPFFNVTRIMWTSSANHPAYPNGFLFYFENKSSTQAVINNIAFYDGTDNYYEHYWNDSNKNFSVDFFRDNIVDAFDVSGGKIKFNEIIPTQEYLVEFNVTHMGRTYSIIHKTRPIVTEYDVATGWANEDAKTETFLKAITSMHFDTVIYNIGDGYMQLDEEIKAKYPIKWFNGGAEHLNFGDEYIPKNPDTPYNDMVINLADVHAALPFGEPQLNDSLEKYQPMRCFNKLAMYRNVPVATNITLTHEPAFYRFAGMSDLIHYDAYRINAPFSDFWPFYFDWASEGKYGWWYASPLETIGDYMRTMNSLYQPNKTAAWTQGAKTWNILRRFSKTEQFRYSPNPYELRIQAYQNVGNGANSLYWFNIKSEDLLYNYQSSKEMMEVNRELAVIRDYLSYQVPFFYQRDNNYDLNANIGEDCAIFFINDLNYRRKGSEYQYNGIRENQSFSFNIPSYLTGNDALVKITKEGVFELSYNKEGNSISFTDSVDMTGLYVFIRASDIDNITYNYNAVREREVFNYFENEEDMQALRQLVGLKEGEEYRPTVVIEQNKTFAKIYSYIYIAASSVLIIIFAAVFIEIKLKSRRKK